MFVIDTGHGVLLKPYRPFEPTALDEVAGSLPYDGPPRIVEEMDDAIPWAVVEREHDRR